MLNGSSLYISISNWLICNILTLIIVSDPYVKVWLQFGDKRVEKRKTAIYKCTLNPVFNDTFAFNVPWEKIRECSLDVMVMDFDNIGRNELIGRILLAGKLIYFNSREHRDIKLENCCIKSNKSIEFIN